MSHQIDTLLAALRPKEAGRVEELFPPDAQARILAEILVGEDRDETRTDPAASRKRSRSHTPGSGAEHTRGHRHRKRRTAALGAAAAAVAVVAVTLILSLGPETQRAFAGWSASPTAPSSGQVQAAEAACMTQLPTGSPAAQSGFSVVLTDTRGPYTVLILQDARTASVGSCFVGPSPGSAEVSLEVGGPLTPLRAGEIGVLSSGLAPASGATQRTSEGNPYTMIEGPAGPGVVGVTLVLSDGSHVTASTAGGWYAAWWPGTQRAVTAEVRSPSGTATQQLAKQLPTRAN